MPHGDAYSVPVEQLRWVLDPASLEFETTNDLPSRSHLPGQARAVRSLEIGLGLRSRGYNVFLAGPAGTHRTELLNELFKELDHSDFTPEDFCYVQSFRQADLPRLLRFPGGRGEAFRASMAGAVQRLRDGIPRLLASEVYAKRRRARVKRYTARLELLAQPLKEKAEPQGLSLVQVQIGDRADAELLPLVDEEPLAFEDLEAMVEREEFSRADLQRLIKVRETLLMELRTFAEASDKLATEASQDLASLDAEFTRPYINGVLSGVHREFQSVEGVTEFLREIEGYLEDRLDLFRRGQSDPDVDEEEVRDGLQKLTVNLVLDNAGVEERPIVYEPNPTLTNLRGTIDRETRPGGRVLSDFTHIKAGSLLRAHGGFLVLHADDLESEGHGSWNLVKRTLRTRQLRIEFEGGDSVSGARSLRPEPIPLDVKIVIVGTPDLYQTLLDADPDFAKLFKIKAEFDSEMELSPHSLKEYAQLVRTISDRDGLPPFAADGVAAVVEHGVRLAGHRSRISTQFSKIEDLVRESAFWARKRTEGTIHAQDVRRALDERRRRVNLYEEKTQRYIREGTIYIATEGSVVGQINGLTVIDLGNHRFGRPARITASVGAGTTGIVNIERQAALSGSYHDKGLLILTGFLREMFASRSPLAISAAITLEQSYTEVDGDSATIAELLALLSDLGEFPIRQDIAVTGSMDQKGRVQPVGGLNEKIEGFFDLCSSRGLTGIQGVLIPHINLPQLMLRPDLVEAVKAEEFHIYAVRRIEEAVELMTELHCGARKDDEGNFPPKSAFARVAARLAEFAEAARPFGMWPQGS